MIECQDAIKYKTYTDFWELYNKKICILELMKYSIFRISYIPGTLLVVGCKIVSKTDTSEIYILIREPDTVICKQI